MAMITGHSSDSWKLQKRCVNPEHWKWLLQRRTDQFRDAVLGLYNGYRWECKSLVYDKAEIHAMIDTGGWNCDFGLALLNWAFAAKPKTPQHLRRTLDKFYRSGMHALKRAKYPIVPKMPDFACFLDEHPWKTPSRTKHGK